ncbi:MAG TPA: hypothetical protein VG406_16745 [Isosphaeraceae bacterium]|jgi:hypothetical protein|nr:hypothetical protein [Isosphaeraceae bacterium]
MRRPRWRLAGVALAGLTAGAAAGFGPAGDDPGPLVRALWVVQRHGTVAAADPRNDEKAKGALSKALGKAHVLTSDGIEGLMEPAEFSRLAGPDGRLDDGELRRIVAEDVPGSRARLLPKVREHADYLTTTFDLIDEPHRAAGERLADWIAKQYRPGEPLHVIVICTGNTRRSVLGATWGNIAAAYYGMPEVRFHSGGTKPTAVNPRTIRTLRAIGVEVEPTGAEAPRGEPATANPSYTIRWGSSGAPGMEAKEFSKRYDDASHPHSGFAALMVCGEADTECPTVRGAALRLAMPYLDPKIYDGGAYEAAKYDERRDDIGRLMLAVFARARRESGR